MKLKYDELIVQTIYVHIMKQFENKRIEFLNSLITEFENSDELYHENGIIPFYLI
jgi:hypothetical protein